MSLKNLIFKSRNTPAHHSHGTTFRQKKRRVLFEALEDRRVLAVTPLTDPEIASLRNNVAVLQSFGDRLEDFAQLNSTFPLFESTIGELVDIGGAFGETFVTPLQNYLDSANPTIQGLRDVVATVIANNFHISGEAKAPKIEPDELSFTIDVSFLRKISAEIDLADHVPESELNVEGSLSGELKFEFNFNVTIGIDRTKASVSEGAFVEFLPGENSITAKLNLNTPQPIQASLGILGVTLDNPSTELNLGASFDTINERVFVSELASADLASLVTINTAGANNFNLTLPINASIAGTTLAGGQLTVVDTNLFDSIKPTIDLVTDAFDPFRTISTTGLLSVLNQARNVLGRIDAFDIEIPFTGGTKLSDVLNLGQAIGDQIIDPVSHPEKEGQPGFSNLQQFLSLVADSARYDAATKSIEFDIRFDHTFDIASFAVDFGASLGDLNNFSLSADTELSVAADLGAAFTVGLVLAQPGAAFDPDGDSIFGIEMDTHRNRSRAELKTWPGYAATWADDGVGSSEGAGVTAQ